MTKTNHLLQELIDTVQTLRSQNGCPWDKRQTSRSLIKCIKSETAELIQGIENDDIDNICEELGDVLYLIIMLTEINKEREHFQLSDVLQAINKKLIRRHPHVFAGATYASEKELAEQWEAIKAGEKKKISV